MNPGNVVRVRARNGGRASVYEANAWAQIYSTGILSGDGIIPSSTAMSVEVVGNADAPMVLIATTPDGYKIALDVVGTATLALSAPASGTKITSVIAFTENLSESSTDNEVTGSPSSCGLITVDGAGESAPTEQEIRTAITVAGGTGTTASYVIVAEISIASGANEILTSDIENVVSKILPEKIELEAGSVGADKIDFTSMKKWVPDYDNSTQIQDFTTSSSTYTAKADGFVHVFWQGWNPNTDVDVSIRLNGTTRIARAIGENVNASGHHTASLTSFFPISAGDTVEFTINTGTSKNRVEAFFIPGKWA